MMKTGHVERTNDRDYEVEERYAASGHPLPHVMEDADSRHRRYRTMEAAANRLQKEAKGYLDSLRGMPYSYRRPPTSPC